MADNAQLDAVEDKLVELFAQRRPEDMVRIFHFFLNSPDKSEAAIRVLFKLLDNPQAFSFYASRLSDDTKTAERNPQFCEDMKIMYECILNFAGDRNISPESVDLIVSLAPYVVNPQLGPTASGMIAAWARIPPDARVQVLATVVKYAPENLQVVAESTHHTVAHFGGRKVAVALALAQLSWEAIKSINDWWNGEISGCRCAKNIFDAAGSAAGAYGGSYAGAALATMYAPGVGTVVGGVIGGIVGSVLGGLSAEWLTCHVFNLPKSVALEKAYAHLGVSQSATNDEISKAYQKKCLKTHPDKGGSHSDFLLLQIQMQIIRTARGQ